MSILQQSGDQTDEGAPDPHLQQGIFRNGLASIIWHLPWKYLLPVNLFLPSKPLRCAFQVCLEVGHLRKRSTAQHLAHDTVLCVWGECFTVQQTHQGPHECDPRKAHFYCLLQWAKNSPGMCRARLSSELGACYTFLHSITRDTHSIQQQDLDGDGISSPTYDTCLQYHVLHKQIQMGLHLPSSISRRTNSIHAWMCTIFIRASCYDIRDMLCTWNRCEKIKFYNLKFWARMGNLSEPCSHQLIPRWNHVSEIYRTKIDIPLTFHAYI